METPGRPTRRVVVTSFGVAAAALCAAAVERHRTPAPPPAAASTTSAAKAPATPPPLLREVRDLTKTIALPVVLSPNGERVLHFERASIQGRLELVAVIQDLDGANTTRVETRIPDECRHESLTRWIGSGVFSADSQRVVVPVVAAQDGFWSPALEAMPVIVDERGRRRGTAFGVLHGFGFAGRGLVIARTQHHDEPGYRLLSSVDGREQEIETFRDRWVRVLRTSPDGTRVALVTRGKLPGRRVRLVRRTAEFDGRMVLQTSGGDRLRVIELASRRVIESQDVVADPVVHWTADSRAILFRAHPRSSWGQGAKEQVSVDRDLPLARFDVTSGRTSVLVPGRHDLHLEAVLSHERLVVSAAAGGRLLLRLTDHAMSPLPRHLKGVLGGRGRTLAVSLGPKDGPDGWAVPDIRLQELASWPSGRGVVGRARR